ncbi:uncharacterized protein VICG_01061 [Vittaforma corneae ATCC 50505]|uniref:Uncharacterized protein n=1 Tax=Vittaforma corneae (strain ATCC 50505) TaxID=993615 RepID=L2GNI1_VITCO|nr:uncharacterized protein VICG_01061 [Vittaforma corneae ATCC 50505]ELA41877.1 hypothetical protein VICG_01061 [Vittaforma corneae ATCC 50505]
MGLKEIEKIINKHSGEQRAEIINYYKKMVDDAVESQSRIDSKLVRLVVDASRYLPSSERQLILDKTVNTKAFQIRTFILNTLKSDFSTEKSHFSSFSEWMVVAIQEISNTFYEANDKLPAPIDKELVENFHKKFCGELRLIFCSNEKFGSAGNQLLIDLKKYFESFEGFEDEKTFLTDRVRKNFNIGKAFTKEKINEIFGQIEQGNSERRIVK